LVLTWFLPSEFLKHAFFCDAALRVFRLRPHFVDKEQVCLSRPFLSLSYDTSLNFNNEKKDLLARCI
jgi:hypothetical protein